MKIDNDLSLIQVEEKYAEEFFLLAIDIKRMGMAYCPEIVEEVTSLEKSKWWLNDYFSKFQETKAPDYFILYQKRIAGVIGYAPWDEGQKWGEIGYWVAPMYQRKGIAKRAIQFVLSISKKEFGLEETRFLIEPENVASLKLAQSLGPANETTTKENGKSYISYSISCK